MVLSGERFSYAVRRPEPRPSFPTCNLEMRLKKPSLRFSGDRFGYALAPFIGRQTEAEEQYYSSAFMPMFGEPDRSRCRVKVSL